VAFLNETDWFGYRNIAPQETFVDLVKLINPLNPVHVTLGIQCSKYGVLFYVRDLSVHF